MKAKYIIPQRILIAAINPTDNPYLKAISDRIFH
jgi:hypothetical protein